VCVCVCVCVCVSQIVDQSKTVIWHDIQGVFKVQANGARTSNSGFYVYSACSLAVTFFWPMSYFSSP